MVSSKIILVFMICAVEKTCDRSKRTHDRYSELSLQIYSLDLLLTTASYLTFLQNDTHVSLHSSIKVINRSVEMRISRLHIGTVLTFAARQPLLIDHEIINVASVGKVSFYASKHFFQTRRFSNDKKKI